MRCLDSTTRACMAVFCLTACAGQQPPPPTTPLPVAQAPQTKEVPPPSGPTPELSFPAVARTQTDAGLEINAIELNQLPVVDLKLIIRSGSASDPKDMPGTAQIVAAMLKEGTRTLTSAQIAERVDFLGARLWIDNDDENIYIQMRALAEHLDEAMGLIADLSMRPAFSAAELTKLRKRELDRLALSQKNPNFLAAREFFKRLYGDHPYAHVDTTEAVVRKIGVSHLKAFHRQHFLPNNAILVAAGAVTSGELHTAAQQAFKGWRTGEVPSITYPPPPARSAREVVIIDRPESVQSVILVGNLALRRDSPDYIPLRVANQVLGGSAASRLFMDLREKQSLTYGAYSQVQENVDVGPFQAYAAVRNEVTAQAMTAFMKHLEAIRATQAPAPELQNAKRFLIDQLPLRLDTAVKVVELLAEQRIYGLPDDYWQHFPEAVSAVTPESALAAAQHYIRADDALIVVVGRAAAVKDALSAYGPVTVIDPEGKVLSDPSLTPAPANVAPSAPTETQARPTANQPQPSSTAASNLEGSSKGAK